MKALVVDDSSVVRKVIGRMLKDLGFAVESSCDGLAALERCSQGMPNVILLDWHMPHLDGIGFLKRLRATEGGRHPKVVLCTTENRPASIAEALEAGADEFIMKPFDSEILTLKLADVGFDVGRVA